MKYIVTLLLIGFATFSYGQSKKTMNNELKKNLERSMANYDTILGKLRQTQGQLDKAKGEASKNRKMHEDLVKRESEIRKTLTGNFQLLKNLGFNADSMYKLDQIPPLPSPKFIDVPESEIIWKQIRLLGVNRLNNFPDDVKLKEQNAILALKVAEYDSINRQNIRILEGVIHKADSLNAVNQQNKYSLEVHKRYNDELAYKSNIIAYKCYEVKEAKMEVLRIKAYKINEERYQKALKQEKNGTIPFVKPIIPDFSELDALGEPVLFMDESKPIKKPVDDPFPPSPPKPEPVMVDVIEEPADFPGGMKALKEYLVTNIVVPQKVLDGEIYGKVFLRFNISETGKISNVKVQRGIPDCTECDEEAKRVVENMPDWKPGKTGGKAVSSVFTLPITFRSLSLKTD